MPINVPKHARCLSCRYLLRELEEPVCPECSRRFDPEDASTFNAQPSQRRKKRVIIWSTTILLICIASYALWPPKLLEARITFTYTPSGQVITITRWELMSPEWLPLRYPSYTKRSVTEGQIQPADDESFNVIIRAIFSRGSITGSGMSLMGDRMVVNNVEVNPENGAMVLKTLLAPENQGISISSSGTTSLIKHGPAGASIVQTDTEQVESSKDE